MTLRRAVSFALALLLSWPASRPVTAQEPPPETLSSPADVVTDKAIHRASSTSRRRKSPVAPGMVDSAKPPRSRPWP